MLQGDGVGSRGTALLQELYQSRLLSRSMMSGSISRRCLPEIGSMIVELKYIAASTDWVSWSSRAIAMASRASSSKTWEIDPSLNAGSAIVKSLFTSV